MTGTRPFDSESLVLDRHAARAVDLEAMEAYGVPGIVLMENAARALCDAAIDLLDGAVRDRAVVIVAGGGNNGGDGWALARHLANHGAAPVVVALGEPREGTDAAVNAGIARRMAIAEATLATAPQPALVVDAIFGTGLDRPIGGAAADAVAWINGQSCPVLAVDVPSGLDCDAGAPVGAADAPCVRATCTVSFVAGKPGFLRAESEAFTGRVLIGDIGAPAAIVRRLGRPARDPEARLG